MALKPEKPPRAPAYEAPAVQKAFELLAMVADSAEGLGVSELSTALGYSKGTIHGLVQALLGGVRVHPVLSGHLDQRPHDQEVLEIPERAPRERHGTLQAQLGCQRLSEMRQRNGEVGQPVHLLLEQTGLQDLALQVGQDDDRPQLAEPDPKHGIPQAGRRDGETVERRIRGPEYADTEGRVRFEGLHEGVQVALGVGHEPGDLDGRIRKDRHFQGILPESLHDFRQEESVVGRQFLQVRG